MCLNKFVSHQLKKLTPTCSNLYLTGELLGIPEGITNKDFFYTSHLFPFCSINARSPQINNTTEIADTKSAKNICEKHIGDLLGTMIITSYLQSTKSFKKRVLLFKKGSSKREKRRFFLNMAFLFLLFFY